jgi:hypothetical protein
MMSAVKPPRLPAILLANNLLDGDVVFGTATGWTRNPSEALIARDAVTAAALDAAGQAAFAAREVVDAYLVDVEIGPDGRPAPRHFREKFKTLGPSNRPDLGKQAEYPSTVAARR